MPTATNNPYIRVGTKVNRSLRDTWRLWTEPMHVIKWNAASEDWHTTFSENDVRTGGKFLARMEAKDGSVGFDFAGVYAAVDPQAKIEYKLDDGRQVKITFTSAGKDSTTVVEEFQPESTHTHDMQRAGWQAILDNFKAYAEGRGRDEILKFAVTIKAPVKTVNSLLMAETTYCEWTKPFDPHSSYEGSWEKHATIRFLGFDDDGKRRGMVSRIREHIPNKFISIEHLGLIDGKREIMEGPQVAAWQGALESYYFKEAAGQTTFEVWLEVGGEHAAYFKETWPQALDRLKEICEKPGT